MRGATRPNCQPLTLSHLEFDGGPTVSMPAAARPHCILPARNSETLTIFQTSSESINYVQVRRNYGRQPGNQLRGARGASAHACSTGLSAGRRLMPMTALCGAAALCRGARQLPHTRRVVERAQIVCSCSCMRGCGRKLSCICMQGCGRKSKGVDENSWQSRQLHRGF